MKAQESFEGKAKDIASRIESIVKEEKEEKKEDDIDPRWDKLKQLLTDK